MRKLLCSHMGVAFLSASALAGPSVYSPPLSTPSSFTTLTDGSKIHSIEAGNGEAVIFLHGLPASAYLWRNVVPAVGKHYHAIAPDLPGYRHSDVPASGKVSIAAIATALTSIWMASKVTSSRSLSPIWGPYWGRITL